MFDLDLDISLPLAVALCGLFFALFGAGAVIQAERELLRHRRRDDEELHESIAKLDQLYGGAAEPAAADVVDADTSASGGQIDRDARVL